MVDYDQSLLHAASYTLHYGLGAFEGVRSYQRGDGQRAVFRLDDHIRRLLDSCRTCRIEVPYSAVQLADACVLALRENDLGEAYLRPLVFLGDGTLAVGATGQPVRVYVGVRAWMGYFSSEHDVADGLRLIVSSLTRPSGLPEGKICGQYVISSLAKREAAAAGCADALLLDDRGRVAEGTAENVFLVRAGRLVTPPLSSPILAGITRDSLIVLARELGIPVEEEAFARDRLYVADEVFLCGTSAEVAPVREIDGRRIGDGKPGPITTALSRRFAEVLRGPSTPHPEWLTFF